MTGSLFPTGWDHYLSGRPFFQEIRLVQTRSWRLVLAAGLIIGASLWWFLLGGH